MPPASSTTHHAGPTASSAPASVPSALPAGDRRKLTLPFALLAAFLLAAFLLVAFVVVNVASFEPASVETSA